MYCSRIFYPSIFISSFPKLRLKYHTIFWTSSDRFHQLTASSSGQCFISKCAYTFGRKLSTFPNKCMLPLMHFPLPIAAYLLFCDGGSNQMKLWSGGCHQQANKQLMKHLGKEHSAPIPLACCWGELVRSLQGGGECEVFWCGVIYSKLCTQAAKCNTWSSTPLLFPLDVPCLYWICFPHFSINSESYQSFTVPCNVSWPFFTEVSGS